MPEILRARGGTVLVARTISGRRRLRSGRDSLVGSARNGYGSWMRRALGLAVVLLLAGCGHDTPEKDYGGSYVGGPGPNPRGSQGGKAGAAGKAGASGAAGLGGGGAGPGGAAGAGGDAAGAGGGGEAAGSSAGGASTGGSSAGVAGAAGAPAGGGGAGG